MILPTEPLGGSQLDSIGFLWAIERIPGEDDAAMRGRLIDRIKEFDAESEDEWERCRREVARVALGFIAPGMDLAGLAEREANR